MPDMKEMKQIEIEASFSESFIKSFYRNFGYYPAVIMKNMFITKNKINNISLDELKLHFTKFLPKSFEKTISLESPLQKRVICDIRYIYYRLARNMGYTLEDIAQSVKKKDHTTVIHGLHQFKNLYETDTRFREKYQTILDYIKSKYEPSIMDHLDKMEFES